MPKWSWGWRHQRAGAEGGALGALPGVGPGHNGQIDGMAQHLKRSRRRGSLEGPAPQASAREARSPTPRRPAGSPRRSGGPGGGGTQLVEFSVARQQTSGPALAAGAPAQAAEIGASSWERAAAVEFDSSGSPARGAGEQQAAAESYESPRCTASHRRATAPQLATTAAQAAPQA